MQNCANMKVSHSALIVRILVVAMSVLITAHAQFLSRHVVGCIFCYDRAMIEQIHMGNAAICSEAGDISFSQDSRKLHKLF